MYIFLAFVSGFLVIISMIINSHLAKRIGVFQGTFINFLIGALFATIILSFNKNYINLSFENLINIPLWAYLGGLTGVIIVSISNIVVPKIPTIYTTLLIFIGQLITGIMIDYYMGNIISKGKIIGGALILTGLIFNFYIDKKYFVKNNLHKSDVNKIKEGII